MPYINHLIFWFIVLLIGMVALAIMHKIESRKFDAMITINTSTKLITPTNKEEGMPTTKEMNDALNGSFVEYTISWMDDTEYDEDGLPIYHRASVVNLRDALKVRAEQGDTSIPMLHMDKLDLNG